MPINVILWLYQLYQMILLLVIIFAEHVKISLMLILFE